jgi:hypothetical protein
MSEGIRPAATPEQLQDAQRKIRKFLARSAPGLGEPIVAMRDPDNGQLAFMQLHFEQQGHDGPRVLTRITRETIDKRTLDSVIVECRVFFMSEEDCYLPGVVKALQRMVTVQQARDRRPLRDMVGRIVRDARLVSPEGEAGMYSGRLEMDNGVGPGRLLSGDQIAMDYINGVAMHEDEASLERLSNVSGADTARWAVVVQLNALIQVVENVRAQILHDIEVGHFSLEG